MSDVVTMNMDGDGDMSTKCFSGSPDNAKHTPTVHITCLPAPILRSIIHFALPHEQSVRTSLSIDTQGFCDSIFTSRCCRVLRTVDHLGMGTQARLGATRVRLQAKSLDVLHDYRLVCTAFRDASESDFKRLKKKYDKMLSDTLIERSQKEEEEEEEECEEDPEGEPEVKEDDPMILSYDPHAFTFCAYASIRAVYAQAEEIPESVCQSAKCLVIKLQPMPTDDNGDELQDTWEDTPDDCMDAWLEVFAKFDMLEGLEFHSTGSGLFDCGRPIITPIAGANLVLAAASYGCPHLKYLKMRSWDTEVSERMVQANGDVFFHYFAYGDDIQELEGNKFSIYGPTQEVLERALQHWYRTSGGIQVLDINHHLRGRKLRDAAFYTALAKFAPDLRFLGGEGAEQHHFDTTMTDYVSKTTLLIPRMKFLRACNHLEAMEITTKDLKSYHKAQKKHWSTLSLEDQRKIRNALKTYEEENEKMLDWLGRDESIAVQRRKEELKQLEHEEFGIDEEKERIEKEEEERRKEAAEERRQQWLAEQEERKKLEEERKKEADDSEEQSIKGERDKFCRQPSLFGYFSKVLKPNLRYLRLVQSGNNEEEEDLDWYDLMRFFRSCPNLEEYVTEGSILADALTDPICVGLREFCPRLRFIYTVDYAGPPDRFYWRLNDRGLRELAQLKCLEFVGLTSFCWATPIGLADFFVESTCVAPCTTYNVHPSPPQGPLDPPIKPSNHLVVAFNMSQGSWDGLMALETNDMIMPWRVAKLFMREMTKKERIDTLRQNLCGTDSNGVKKKRRNVTFLFYFGVMDEIEPYDDPQAKSAYIDVDNTPPRDPDELEFEDDEVDFDFENTAQSEDDTSTNKRDRGSDDDFDNDSDDYDFFSFFSGGGQRHCQRKRIKLQREIKQRGKDAGKGHLKKVVVERYPFETCSDVLVRLNIKSFTDTSCKVVAFTTSYTAFKKVSKVTTFPWLGLPILL